jgi:hypothetical protein
MSILRFRVTFDDYDDVQRDIDLKADNSFFDLFIELLKSVQFDNQHVGEFFLADHNWRKGSLVGSCSASDHAKLSKTELVDHIDDPHQKFLFYYDKDANWAFTIELIKIIPSPEYKVNYPRIYWSVGVPPVQYKETLIIPNRDRSDQEPRVKRKRKVEDSEDEADALLQSMLMDDEEDDIVEETEDTEIELEVDFELETDTEIAKLAEEFSNTTEIDTSVADSSEDDYGSDADDEFGMDGGDDDEFGGGYSKGGFGGDYDE